VKFFASRKIQKLDLDKAGIGFTAIRGIVNHHRIHGNQTKG
jgi:hypothetical protein